MRSEVKTRQSEGYGENVAQCILRDPATKTWIGSLTTPRLSLVLRVYLQSARSVVCVSCVSARGTRYVPGLLLA